MLSQEISLEIYLLSTSTGRIKSNREGGHPYLTKWVIWKGKILLLLMRIVLAVDPDIV